MSYTKKDRLIARINDNYADFKSSLRGASRDSLFEMAGRIAVVSEAHKILTTCYSWNEEVDGEVDFYLLFRNPLTIIADAWEKQRGESMIAFYDAMYGIAYSDQAISQYPLIEGVADDIVYIGNAGHGIWPCGGI